MSLPDYSRLKAQLRNTGLSRDNFQLFQLIDQLLDAVNQSQSILNTNITTINNTPVNNIQQIIQLLDDSSENYDSSTSLIPGPSGPIGSIGLTGPSLGIDDGSYAEDIILRSYSVQELNSNLTAGSVIFVGPSGFLIQDNANFFWDEINKRIGFGTPIPQRTLHVVGTDGSVASFPSGVGAKDFFIVENNGNANLGFIGAVATSSEFKFYVSGATNKNGSIGYNHNTDQLFMTGKGNGTQVVFFDSSGNFNLAFLVAQYNNINTKGYGVPAIYGLDNRTGLTGADGAAITLYTVIAANNIFRVWADIFATAAVTGTATYTITWTENSTTQTIVVTATAINTLATANAIIRPDNGTNITAQLTGVFTGTFTVVGLAEQVA